MDSLRRCLPQNLLEEYPFTVDDALALQLDLLSLPPFIRDGGRGDAGREFAGGESDPDRLPSSSPYPPPHKLPLLGSMPGVGGIGGRG